MFKLRDVPFLLGALTGVFVVFGVCPLGGEIGSDPFTKTNGIAVACMSVFAVVFCTIARWCEDSLGVFRKRGS